MKHFVERTDSGTDYRTLGCQYDNGEYSNRNILIVGEGEEMVLITPCENCEKIMRDFVFTDVFVNVLRSSNDYKNITQSVISKIEKAARIP